MTMSEKLFPVEAQAVPDLPVAWMRHDNVYDITTHPEKGPADPMRFPVYRRPTPAAADLTVDGLMDRAKRYRWAAEGESVEGAERVLRAYAAELVAASPAGVPTGWTVDVHEDTERSWLTIHAPNGNVQSFSCERGTNGAMFIQDFGIALASPVAPVGAPTGWHPFSEKPTKPGRYIVAHRGGIGGHAYYDDPNKPGWSQMPNWNPTHWREAPGRQGCELATDATKPK